MQNDTRVKSDPKGGERPDQRSPSSELSKAEQGTNHGEGNPEAAARFNKAEQEFVNSSRGQEKIREAGIVRPDEEAQLEEAERMSRSLPTDRMSKKP